MERKKVKPITNSARKISRSSRNVIPEVGKVAEQFDTPKAIRTAPPKVEVKPSVFDEGMDDVIPHIEHGEEEENIIDETVDILEEDDLFEDDIQPSEELFEQETFENEVLNYTPKELSQYLRISPISVAEVYVLIAKWSEMIDENNDLAETKLKQLNLELVRFKEGKSSFNTVDEITKHFTPPPLFTEEEEMTKDGVLAHGLTFMENAVDVSNFKDVGIMKAVIPNSNNDLLYLDNILGVGRPIKLKLLNSGFRINLKYPTRSMRKAFRQEVTMIGDTVGATLTVVNMNSFEYHKVNKVIIDMIASLIVSSTLNVPDPIKYIKSEDLYILMLGVLKSIYPDGLPFNMPCVESGTLNEYGKPSCTRSATGTISVEKLIYTNFDNVPEAIKRCLAVTKTNGLELKDLFDARTKDGYRDISESTYVNNTEISFHFTNMDLEEVVAVGDDTMSYFEKLILDSFDNGKSVEEIRREELSGSLLRLNVCLKHIVVGGKKILMTGEKIGMLDSIVENEDTRDAFHKALTAFRESSPYRIGIPAYQCGCGVINGTRLDLRPINPVHLFLRAVLMKG